MSSISEGSSISPNQLFMKAIEHGQVRTIQNLLDNHLVRVNAEFEEIMKYPLHIATHCRQVDVVHLLLINNAMVDVRDAYGKTPLHIAALRGLNGIAKLLINYKSDINARDNKSNTPLYYALTGGSVEVLNIFINAGSAVNLIIEDGLTYLTEACQFGRTEMVQLLLDNGAKLQCSYAVLEQKPLYLAVSGNYPEIVEILSLNGANVNSVIEFNGSTPLQIAIECGKLRMIKTLLRLGANVNGKCRRGLSPLHLATDKGHLDTVILLLQYKANVNCKGKKNETPIHFCNNRNILRYLILYGADVDHENDIGKLKLAGRVNVMLTKTFHSCQKEIKKIKSVNLSPNVNLFDVLWMKPIILARYVNNKSLKLLYENKFFEEKAKNYGHLLKAQFEIGLQKQILLDSAKKSLRFLSGINIPDLCFQELFNYFSDAELNNLERSGNLLLKQM